MKNGTKNNGRTTTSAVEQEIMHLPENRRFEMNISGVKSVVDYEIFDGTMNVTRVYVPYELTGQGLASRMTRYVLTYARENNMKVIPTCSFIKVYMQRHPEYQDLLTRFGNIMNHTKKHYAYE